MRVAMISTWESHCGIATYTRALREQLLELGIECDVIAIDRTKVRYLARQEMKPYFRELAERAAGYDLVHVQHEHGFFGGAHPMATSVSVTRDFLGRLARHGAPVVVTFHTEPLDVVSSSSAFSLAFGMAKRTHFRAAMALMFRRHKSLRAIVHTRSSRRAFVDAGMPADALDVVPHGIHAPTRPIPTEDQRRDARERLGLAPDDVVLTQFGFLANYKGIATSAKALHDLPEHFRLAVLGDVHPHGGDEALETILREAKEPDVVTGETVEERIDLRGWIPPAQLDDWRDAASIALAPYHDVLGFSFSGALTWAFGAGVPIVASRIPAFVEIQQDADCLMLVAPSAPHELAHRVKQLDEDRAASDRLVTAARAFAERCSWQNVAELHAELYERSLADHSAAKRTSGSTSLRSARSASRTNGSRSSQDGASRSRSANALR